MKRIVVIAGTAALAAGVGFGAAAAYADPSPSPSASGGTTGADRPPALAAPGVPGHHLGGPHFGQMLHGEAVTKDEGGAVKTHDWQNGVVTAVSGSSVTVRSSDGTTWTWTLTGDTKVRENDKDGSAADVKTGDKVAISGLRTGGTRTAATVLDPPPDRTKMRERMREHLPHLREHLKRDLPSPPA
jgi:hypothetical protein